MNDQPPVGQPRGRADAWALEHPVLASGLGSALLLVFAVVLGNAVVGLVIAVVWGVMQFLILRARSRDLE